MVTKPCLLAAVLIFTVPAFAANGGAGAVGSANSSTPVGHGGGSGGGGGASFGGGAAHGGGLGAHSAAMSTHLGGAGHALHAASAHALTARAAQNRVAMTSKSPKKPGPGEERTRHLFLHRSANYSPLDWTICMQRYVGADGWRSDCDRPAKNSASPHT